MRALVRLVVLIAVLLSSVALAPLASADDTTPGGTGTTDQTTGTETPSGTSTPTPSADPTSGATTGSPTGATTPPPTGTTTPASPAPTSPATAQSEPKAVAPVTKVDSYPANPTSVPAGAVVPSVFTFHAEVDGKRVDTATFQCRILGPGGKVGKWEGCPGGVVGQATYPDLVA
ncbi:MAG TPA: hypothetical protein VFP51_13330, partial [Nocardioidaceae bacterium]|nr:hypothetical protein [Nocardioidaceae bacterium]